MCVPEIYCNENVFALYIQMKYNTIQIHCNTNKTKIYYNELYYNHNMLHWNILQWNCENFEICVNETTKFDVPDPFMLLLNDRLFLFKTKDIRCYTVILSGIIANRQVWLLSS